MSGQGGSMRAMARAAAARFPDGGTCRTLHCVNARLSEARAAAADRYHPARSNHP